MTDARETQTRETRELGKVLEPAYDEDRTASTWQRIAEARSGRRRARRAPAWTWGIGLAATAAAATIAVVLWLGAGGRHALGKPLASTDPGVSLGEGARVDAVGGERMLAMDDGSHVALAADTHLQVLANAGDRFVTLLEHGVAKFDVKEHGPRRWEIETALATVEVVGTAFTVEHSATKLVVTVQRGVVMVRGERVPGRVVRLTAGQSVEVTAGDEVATAAETNREQRTGTGNENGTGAPAPAPAPASASASVPVSVPASVPASGAGTTASTTATAAAHAGARTTATHGRMDDALAKADQLRAAGDAAGAADLLDAALSDDDHSPAAGLAAFTLGRLALDKLDQPERAAKAFARVIALGSPHGLLEDAYARRAEALIRAGDRGAAEDALSEYERAFPEARRAPALRAQLQGK